MHESNEPYPRAILEKRLITNFVISEFILIAGNLLYAYAIARRCYRIGLSCP